MEARDNPAFEAYRRLDLFYVENWSLALDLMILLGTIDHIVLRPIVKVVYSREDRRRTEAIAALQTVRDEGVAAVRPRWPAARPAEGCRRAAPIWQTCGDALRRHDRRKHPVAHRPSPAACADDLPDREVVSFFGPDLRHVDPPMKLTGAQALIKTLEKEAVEVVFGLPGGCILPAYDPLLESPIRHILVRHEQGAGHMAEGYAHVTGRPGVAMVTSGPAATNLVTPLMDAYMDSIPMVAITGQVPTHGDRQRRLPGVRHRRHHPLGDEAQRAGDDGRGPAAGDPPGVPHRLDRPSRAGARRRPEGRPAERRWSGTGRPTTRSPPRCPATARRRRATRG